MRVLTREQSSQIDRCATTQFGISGLVLMENAGRAAADLLCQLRVTSPIVICCGKGNNAGDGYVIARQLLTRHYQVQILNWEAPSKLSNDARTNYNILKAMDVEMIDCLTQGLPHVANILSDAAWIIDALLGIGGSGAARPPIDQAIEMINKVDAPTFALDVPSGLDCNTGVAPGAVVRASHTCTFLAPKPGLINHAGKDYTGQLHVVDLGISDDVIRVALGENK